jgi:hypothetical protein
MRTLPRPVRDEARLSNPSFAPTEPTSTLATFLQALNSGDPAALQRGWLSRNRRHPLEVR